MSAGGGADRPGLHRSMQITAEHPGDARQRGQIILTGRARPAG
jgi:hypothetical protein